MDKVRKLVKAGSSIRGAIREALGRPFTEVADQHGLKRQSFNSAITGMKAPSKAEIKALIAELGGTEQEWRELLWQAAKPTAVAS